jgi:D-alanine-D-alanine ligase
MRAKRVLLITHEDLVPPENIDDLTEAEVHEIRTEYDVYSTMYNLGHKVRVLGIGDRVSDLRETIRDWKPHLVFNLLEEFGGIAAYDQHVVAYLEMIRQRYTGCNPRGLMLSRDKVLTKQVLAWHRIATPAFHLFPLGKRFMAPRKLRFPLFVKSATEDASLGISQASIVDDMASLRERVTFIHEQVQSDALVEEYIDGRELYIAVLGNSRLTTLPVWELNFGTLAKVQSGIATRRMKLDTRYQEKHGITTGQVQDLDDAAVERLVKLAKRIYRALHLSGYARLDFRMRPDGSVFLLEANANPELARGEDFAESAKVIGIDYESLITRIVNLGLSYMPEWRMYE